MSEAADRGDARPFAFPAARRGGPTPAWIGATVGEARPAVFGRGAPAPEEPLAVEPAPPPEPVAPPPEVVTPKRDGAAAAFARAVVELASARPLAILAAEEQLLELALAIAASIIERELERDPTLHTALARSALETLGDPSDAKLRASHAAYAAILDTLGAPLIAIDGVTVQVTLDPTLEGVGFVVENEQARVDARVPERLRAVRRAIDDERRRLEIDEAG